MRCHGGQINQSREPRLRPSSPPHIVEATPSVPPRLVLDRRHDYVGFRAAAMARLHVAHSAQGQIGPVDASAEHPNPHSPRR